MLLQEIEAKVSNEAVDKFFAPTQKKFKVLFDFLD